MAAHAVHAEQVSKGCMGLRKSMTFIQNIISQTQLKACVCCSHNRMHSLCHIQKNAIMEDSTDGSDHPSGDDEENVPLASVMDIGLYKDNVSFNSLQPIQSPRSHSASNTGFPTHQDTLGNALNKIMNVLKNVPSTEVQKLTQTHTSQVQINQVRKPQHVARFIRASPRQYG